MYHTNSKVEKVFHTVDWYGNSNLSLLFLVPRVSSATHERRNVTSTDNYNVTTLTKRPGTASGIMRNKTSSNVDAGLVCDVIKLSVAVTFLHSCIYRKEIDII